MKKYFFFVLYILFFDYSFSQSISPSDEQQLYKALLAQTSKTLVINITDLPLNNLNSFKNEILAWHEKVSSAVIDINTKKMTIVHFKVLETRELFDVLDKYSIKASRILSYQ
jgi:hypothetical protein